MPNRIIKESINESRGLSQCSFFAQDLYKRLISYADDYGRFNSDTAIMRARLYPREFELITEEDIIDGLCELAGVGKIAFYTAEHFNTKAGVYGAFPNWGKHQRIRNLKNKCPEPKDTTINDLYLRRFVPMSMKVKLLERDGFKCKICGKFITTCRDAERFVKLGTGLFHIDHIVPCSQGGRATLENLRITCCECNLTRKKRFSFDEILEEALKEKTELPQIAANCSELPSESESKSESEYNNRLEVRVHEKIEEFRAYLENLEGRPVTTAKMDIVVRKLLSLSKSESEQIKLLDEAMKNGWKNVYKPERKKNRKPDINRADGPDYNALAAQSFLGRITDDEG